MPRSSSVNSVRARPPTRTARPTRSETANVPYVRLALAAVAGAALLVPLAAAAASGRGSGSGARYCPRYDAYQLHDCRAAPRLPDGPLGRQLRWVLDQLAGVAATLSVEEVRAHLSPGLQRVHPAEEMLGDLRQTLAERGTMRFVGYSCPPRSEQLLALVRSGSGQRGAVAIAVDSALIDSVAVDEAPPTLVPRGPYSGWFDVGAPRLPALHRQPQPDRRSRERRDERLVRIAEPALRPDQGLQLRPGALAGPLGRSPHPAASPLRASVIGT